MRISKFVFLLSIQLILSACSSMLYYPTKQEYSRPESFGLAVEDQMLPISGEDRVHMWVLHSPKVQKPQGVVVYFHGNAENMTSHYLNLRWLPEKGYDVVVFDYRGYGTSIGKASPRNTIDDGTAVLNWVKSRYPTTPLIIYGHSLGSAVAMRTMWETRATIRPTIIFVDGSFASYERAGSHLLSHHWLSWPFQWLPYLLLSDTWAPGDHIAELAPTPLIVMHGEKDAVVDLELGQQVYAMAREPKAFWMVPGSAHNGTFWTNDFVYRDKFLQEIARYLPAKPN